MGVERQISREYGQLQQKISAHLQALEDIPEDGGRYPAEYDQLVASTEELLSFEEGIPERLAEPGRQLSERIVLWSWRGQAAVAAALIVLAIVLGHSLWWLVLLVPHLIGTVAGCAQKVRIPAHMQQRVAALLLHPIAVVVALTVLGLLSAWMIVLVLIGWPAVGVIASTATEAETKGGQA